MNIESVHCMNVDVVDGETEWRTINLRNEVYFMEVTPKPIKAGIKPKYPPGVPLFHTIYGRYLQLYNIEQYEKALSRIGYDLFTPSLLVNTAMVESIEVTLFGNVAKFKGSDITCEISRPKSIAYSHLIRKNQ